MNRTDLGFSVCSSSENLFLSRTKSEIPTDSFMAYFNTSFCTCEWNTPSRSWQRTFVFQFCMPTPALDNTVGKISFHRTYLYQRFDFLMLD